MAWQLASPLAGAVFGSLAASLIAFRERRESTYRLGSFGVCEFRRDRLLPERKLWRVWPYAEISRLGIGEAGGRRAVLITMRGGEQVALSDLSDYSAIERQRAAVRAVLRAGGEDSGMA